MLEHGGMTSIDYPLKGKTGRGRSGLSLQKFFGERSIQMKRVIRPAVVDQSTPLATANKLAEIQETMQELTTRHYHEYYKATTEYGFTKITIPKKRTTG
jgi:hypothetical protein